MTATDLTDLERRLNDVIRAFLAAEPLPLEYRGEMRGVLAVAEQPESANGWVFKIGRGLPEGWK